MSPERQYNAPFPIKEWFSWIQAFFAGREQEFYEQKPEVYERIIDVIVRRYELAKKIGALIDNLFPDRSFQFILDTACGTGIITNELEKRTSKNGRIMGMDLSQAAIDFAKKSKNQRIEWGQSDFHQLPIDTETVDFYHMFGAYRFAEPQKFWAEVNRVLAPGGIGMVSRSYPDMSRKDLQKARGICNELGLQTFVYRLKAKGLINRLTTREALIFCKPKNE
ncbi:hypothetical protein COY07_04800 [Candidatus Peregrinibacteria bacterium CG_4_10_14_0_2_um_filter_43_11]|nr:MAG: hypothetical protein COY07_04800 [Candidatus Peregrinibacteria bacterium CG_4_10_14_0_2_um_filter_43_11]